MSDDMVVTRVETESGGHIEPPLDQKADDFTKLRWHAAVLFADTGIRVSVVRYGRKSFGLRGPGGITSGVSFIECWREIDGIDYGVRALRRIEGER